MKILIADDDAVSRKMVEVLLKRWSHEVITAADGTEALQKLQDSSLGIRLAVLDWMMPGADGPEICRVLRQSGGEYIYVVLLTAREEKEDIIAGLDAGADDYVTKPFNELELRARVQAGVRVMDLKQALAGKIVELQKAMDEVQTLQGLLPICMHCKRIKDEGQAWHRLEEYIQDHSGASFSHALCDECMEKYYPDDD